MTYKMFMKCLKTMDDRDNKGSDNVRMNAVTLGMF